MRISMDGLVAVLLGLVFGIGVVNAIRISSVQREQQRLYQLLFEQLVQVDELKEEVQDEQTREDLRNE